MNGRSWHDKGSAYVHSSFIRETKQSSWWPTVVGDFETSAGDSLESSSTSYLLLSGTRDGGGSDALTNVMGSLMNRDRPCFVV